MYFLKETQAVCENTKIWGNMLAEQCFQELRPNAFYCVPLGREKILIYLGHLPLYSQVSQK